MFRFTDWYPYLREYTPESIIVNVPLKLAKKLEIIMSNPATPLAHEGDIDEVMGFVENFLNLNEIIDRINQHIAEFGGTAFIRWNNAYPKDVCPYLEGPRVVKVPGTMGNVCLFRDARVFFYASLNSVRLVNITAREPGSLTPIIIRKPTKITNEVRVFIERGYPIAAVQYYYKERYNVKSMKDFLLAATYYALTLYNEIPHHSATFDVGVNGEKRSFILVEVNPPLSSGRTDKIYEKIDYKEQMRRQSLLLAWTEHNEWIIEEVPYEKLEDM